MRRARQSTSLNRVAYQVALFVSILHLIGYLVAAYLFLF